MSENLDGRVSILESAAAVQDVKFQTAFAADAFINDRESLGALDPYISEDYRWECPGWGSTQNAAEFKDRLNRCRTALSLSVQFLANGIVDIDTCGGSARGDWVVWHPFTWNNEAWVLAGRSHDSFYYAQERWQLASTRLSVEILTRWKEGWGRVPVSSLSGLAQP